METAFDDDARAANEGQNFVNLRERARFGLDGTVNSKGVECDDAGEGEECVDLIGCDVGEVRAE